jgi:hypothetical protein
MYLYRDTIGFGGTFIVGHLAFRWGSHRGIGELAGAHHFQWYGKRWYFFL